MTFGANARILTIFTLFHVAISRIGIATGFVVIYGLVSGKQVNGWTGWFLWTTVLTSATGFLFPVHKLLPSHVVGIISEPPFKLTQLLVLVLFLLLTALSAIKFRQQPARVFSLGLPASSRSLE